MTRVCVGPDWHGWAMPTSGMLSVPPLRKIFFVREFVQAARYLPGGSGKKLAAYQVLQRDAGHLCDLESALSPRQPFWQLLSSHVRE
jgi:hypothetical protein